MFTNSSVKRYIFFVKYGDGVCRDFKQFATETEEMIVTKFKMIQTVNTKKRLQRNCVQTDTFRGRTRNTRARKTLCVFFFTLTKERPGINTERF